MERNIIDMLKMLNYRTFSLQKKSGTLMWIPDIMEEIRNEKQGIYFLGV